MCLCLRKRGNAAHFQLINTADRACWRKPHYAAGWWVAWVGSGGVCRIVITIQYSSFDAAACPQTGHDAGLSLQHEANGRFPQSG